MIALVSAVGVEKKYVIFLEALRAHGFEGEITSDYANRIVLATDNSIYQRLPKAVVYPKHADDLERLARLAAQASNRSIVVTPRGGGTGTNGQSLTDGIVVDVSRHNTWPALGGKPLAQHRRT
jgi:FAD/FMN-containing dehydrogenase